MTASPGRGKLSGSTVSRLALSVTFGDSSPKGRAKNVTARLLPLPLTDFPRAGGRCRVSDKKGSKVALRQQ